MWKNKHWRKVIPKNICEFTVFSTQRWMAQWNYTLIAEGRDAMTTDAYAEPFSVLICNLAYNHWMSFQGTGSDSAWSVIISLSFHITFSYQVEVLRLPERSRCDWLPAEVCYSPPPNGWQCGKNAFPFTFWFEEWTVFTCSNRDTIFIVFNFQYFIQYSTNWFRCNRPHWKMKHDGYRSVIPV